MQTKLLTSVKPVSVHAWRAQDQLKINVPDAMQISILIILIRNVLLQDSALQDNFQTNTSPFGLALLHAQGTILMKTLYQNNAKDAMYHA